MNLHPGDRFELLVPRDAWEAGRIPLSGGFRYLFSPAGTPTAVTLGDASGRVTTGVWDGERGVLEVPSATHLDGVPAASRRLELTLETAEPPHLRIGPLGQASAWSAGCCQPFGSPILPLVGACLRARAPALGFTLS